MNPTALIFNDGANYPGSTDGLGTEHDNRGGNITRVDGGVVFMTTNAYFADANTPAGSGPGPGGRTLLWWSVFSSDGH